MLAFNLEVLEGQAKDLDVPPFHPMDNQKFSMHVEQ